MRQSVNDDCKFEGGAGVTDVAVVRRPLASHGIRSLNNWPSLFPPPSPLLARRPRSTPPLLSSQCPSAGRRSWFHSSTSIGLFFFGWDASPEHLFTVESQWVAMKGKEEEKEDDGRENKKQSRENQLNLSIRVNNCRRLSFTLFLRVQFE